LGYTPRAVAIAAKVEAFVRGIVVPYEKDRRRTAHGPTDELIDELKAKPGGELQVHGSGALTRWLLENDLVDEMILIVIPVILGQGARLFPETGPDLALDLVESRVDSKGVTIQVYRPAGRPRYATA